MQIRREFRGNLRWQYYLMSGVLVSLWASGCSVARPKPVPTEAEPTTPPATTVAPTLTTEPTPAPTVTLSSICSPLAEHPISMLLSLYLTQPFIPPQGANKETGHHGLDFAYYHGGPTGGHIEGTPIQSVLDATIIGSGYNAVYGYYVITETPFASLPAEVAGQYEAAQGESLYLLYGHMQQTAPFALGDIVQCAGVLGHVGNSGSQQFTSDPHLHLETRVGLSGQAVADMAFYTSDITDEQREEYIRWRTSDDFRLVDPTMLLEFQP
ncbi:MAG TPA: M23 family metallopeptidase [Anaerolineales bacterium]|nr:M23 family metallopeptidase [Anaerolineales bacterium]HRQ93310.1 M23 family metallopeptidase [Anaerolineales bacterium]